MTRDDLARRICNAVPGNEPCEYPKCRCRDDAAGKQADAVLAWLAEPAQVERMARAAADRLGKPATSWEVELARNDIRAAVRALGGKDD